MSDPLDAAALTAMAPSPYKDSVVLSSRTAEALSRVGIGDFNPVELPERMAFVALVLGHIADLPEFFPKGKWATIQEIERQVGMCAQHRAFETQKCGP